MSRLLKRLREPQGLQLQRCRFPALQTSSKRGIKRWQEQQDKWEIGAHCVEASQANVTAVQLTSRERAEWALVEILK
jgi:hypothetical protein